MQICRCQLLSNSVWAFGFLSHVSGNSLLFLKNRLERFIAPLINTPLNGWTYTPPGQWYTLRNGGKRYSQMSEIALQEKMLAVLRSKAGTRRNMPIIKSTSEAHTVFDVFGERE